MSVCEQFADQLARDGASPGTIRQYTSRVRGWEASGMEALDYISSPDSMSERKNRRNALSTLQSRGLWLPYKLPVDTFPRFAIHANPVPYISPDQARVFFEDVAERLCGSIRDLTCLKLFYGSGCRQQELVRARRADLYMEEGIPLLRVVGKGRKPREIPLPTYCMKVLARYEKWERPAAEEINEKWVNRGGNARPDYLILGERGRNLFVEPVQRLCIACCAEMGIPRPQHPLHMIRSWYATHLSEAGVQIEDIAALMGHADTRQTQVYLLRNPAKTRRAVLRHAMQDWGSYREEADTLEGTDADEEADAGE